MFYYIWLIPEELKVNVGLTVVSTFKVVNNVGEKEVGCISFVVSTTDVEAVVSPSVYRTLLDDGRFTEEVSKVE